MTFRLTLNGVEFEAVVTQSVCRTETGTDASPFSDTPDWLINLTDRGQLDFNRRIETYYVEYLLNMGDGRISHVIPTDVIIHNPEVGTFVIPYSLARKLGMEEGV